MDEATCGDCKYFKLRAWDNSTDDIGFCLRYPPDINSQFASTVKDEWCGEYSSNN